MAARHPSDTNTMHKVHTDVAVLQTQMIHIVEKVQRIQDDVKNLETKIENNYSATTKLIEKLREESKSAHEEINSKISTLEKWRWMIMGAGAAVGALGVEVVSKFFQ
jgi:uncharacterized protein YoxC